MSSPISYLLVALASLFFFNFHGSTASFLPSKNCPIYSCSDEGLKFHYPFWKIEDSTLPGQHCGYPGFGLKCSDSGKPILALPNEDSFYVKDINFKKSTITLVDIDLVNKTCPRAIHNFSVGTLPFEYSPLDVNLSVYFDCTFVLDWKMAEECSPCTGNGGFCGYNNKTALEFLCFCENGLGKPSTISDGVCKKGMASLLVWLVVTL